MNTRTHTDQDRFSTATLERRTVGSSVPDDEHLGHASQRRRGRRVEVDGRVLLVQPLQRLGRQQHQLIVALLVDARRGRRAAPHQLRHDELLLRLEPLQRHRIWV